VDKSFQELSQASAAIASKYGGTGPKWSDRVAVRRGVRVPVMGEASNIQLAPRDRRIGAKARNRVGKWSPSYAVTHSISLIFPRHAIVFDVYAMNKVSVHSMTHAEAKGLALVIRQSL
jgi:hypothetical protein